MVRAIPGIPFQIFTAIIIYLRLEKYIYGYHTNIYGYCASCLNGQRSKLNKMAEEDDLEGFFRNSIPSLFRQAQRNLHTDNLNVLEYFERRLDDYSFVIRSVILQCEQQSVGEDLIQLLDLLHEEVNGLNGQFQDLCNTQRNFASEMLVTVTIVVVKVDVA